jgi:endonuclease/exonuclease/phosphatase family metal-dependent hydrolase
VSFAEKGGKLPHSKAQAIRDLKIVPHPLDFGLEASMESHTLWLENLRKYERLEELKQSAFFADHGKQIESYLCTPQVVSVSSAGPILHSFLRVVQWNIEKGKRFRPIRERLQTNEILKWADVLILNEVDQGMIRSDNRHVARDLAAALGMHAAFGPAHFELTKGIDEELCLQGENCESLQGNAILSRYPIAETRNVPLPVSFEPYEFHEKRFGSRSCLWVRLRLRDSSLWVGAAHLELRNTPQCRAEQIRHILKYLPCTENEAVLLGGDLNTNSFARGTNWRTLKSILRLLVSSPSRLKKQLLHPESGAEPLFKILGSNGFEWDRLNTNEETARTGIDSLEEAGYLPDSVLRLFRNRLKPYQGYLAFKLDWLLGKKVRALSSGQKRDTQTGVLSLKPGTVRMDNSGPDRISDHLPIYADVDLA